MSHEEPRVARRSASHGSLNGSYAIPDRATSVVPSAGQHPVPHFKPLRSIREHGHTFLDPAASADGMLRKTTETGNIGLFSIKTGRPTILRPRASLGDLRQPHRPVSRGSDRYPGHDDRKRLPSYRDSTSEIISMYGSENQSSSKSVSGTLSPPWDDSGQRSYSMTTCDSKSYTLPRNNESHRGHDFHPGTQRPRSPYPYPTRLPRPGTRPSSPALTENGIVDYSRMVEIDRIPQRTIHHPHKTLFPCKTTRDQPGPLSMRYGINQSTYSLSDNRGPARTCPSPMSRRPPLPNFLHPWDMRPRDRLGSDSSTQSLRTVSLSSMSGGYGCAPPSVPRLQIAKKKPPIFYDYSEDFEDAVDLPPDFPTIANPTPTRVSQSFHPGISDDYCDSKSETVDEMVGQVVEHLRRVTMIESGEHQEENGEGYGSEHDRPVPQCHQRARHEELSSKEPVEEALTSKHVLSPMMQTVACVDVSIPTLKDNQNVTDECQKHGAAYVTESRLGCEESTNENPLDYETTSVDMAAPVAEAACYEDEPLDHHEESDGTKANHSLHEPFGPRIESTELAAPAVRFPDISSSASAMLLCGSSSERRKSRLFSLSSGLSDLASFVKCVDKHMQASDTDNVEHPHVPIPDSRSESGLDHGRDCFQVALEGHAPPRTSSLAHQRMQCFRSKINTPTPIDELERYQVVSTRSGPTLVPQPISPVKMLRVKNSIPQLMKALPPLPGYFPASESPFNPTIVPVEFEPFEFSRLTDARSTLIEPFRSESHSEQSLEGYDPFIFDHGVHKPKLKLKNATSLTSSNIRRLRPRSFVHVDLAPHQTTEMRPSTAGGEYSNPPVKRRLPIKVSRPALGSAASDNCDTVKRRPGFDKSSTVSGLASSQPVDLFSSSKELQLAVLKAGTCHTEPSYLGDQEHGNVSMFNAAPTARIQQVIVVDGDRGVSLDTHLNALHLPRSKIEALAEDEMQSFFSDSYVRPRRGLRKKLSLFRSRRVESRHLHQSPSTRKSGVQQDKNDKKFQQSDMEAFPSNGSRNLPTDLSPMKDHHIITPTRTVRSKLGKLVKGVKYRLRTWGKHKYKNG